MHLGGVPASEGRVSWKGLLSLACQELQRMAGHYICLAQTEVLIKRTRILQSVVTVRSHPLP